MDTMEAETPLVLKSYSPPQYGSTMSGQGIMMPWATGSFTRFEDIKALYRLLESEAQEVWHVLLVAQ